MIISVLRPLLLALREGGRGDEFRNYREGRSGGLFQEIQRRMPLAGGFKNYRKLFHLLSYY
jgi:hypothetical protein